MIRQSRLLGSKLNTSSALDVLPGGDGESEEDEEDEPVTDLKKPNSDEVWWLKQDRACSRLVS